MSWSFIGHRFERTLRWSPEDIIRFAREVGDENPLHHDASYAAATCFGSLIASGAQPVAILMAMCGSQATREAPGVGLEFAFRLVGPAKPNDTIVFVWEVTAIERNERLVGTVVTLQGKAVGSNGRPIVTATAKTLAVDSLS